MRYLTGLRKRLQFEEDPMHEEEDGVEPEPEDEDPEVEEEERVGDVDPLDSASDDSDVDNNETTVELTTFDEAMPDGTVCARRRCLQSRSSSSKMRRARSSKTCASCTTGTSSAGGWAASSERMVTIKSKQVKVDGVRAPGNFVVTYTKDETEGLHNLTRQESMWRGCPARLGSLGTPL